MQGLIAFQFSISRGALVCVFLRRICLRVRFGLGRDHPVCAHRDLVARPRRLLAGGLARAIRRWFTVERVVFVLTNGHSDTLIFCLFQSGA